MKDEQIIIRKAIEADLETVLEFEQGIIKAELPFDITLKTEPTYYHDLKKMIADENAHLVVAELNKKLIASGYARIMKSDHFLKHHQHAFLGMMFVIPEYRGKGINKKIMEELIKWSKSKNISEFRLLTYNDNITAINAYEKMGFEKHIVEMRMGL